LDARQRERTAPEYCAQIFRALRDHYGFSDHELTWFSMHAEPDADHGAGG
jgi:pyrroloquinoline quinone (PQQ) biosynthesis protein C